ncbi:MAG: hypothetical protein LBE27_07270 [Deltaproteobacteria bacterium]|jgi:hypothetical protein|nr:hypothetical protein [Deltaproteobacteria bacterium]
MKRRLLIVFFLLFLVGCGSPPTSLIKGEWVANEGRSEPNIYQLAQKLFGNLVPGAGLGQVVYEFNKKNCEITLGNNEKEEYAAKYTKENDEWLVECMAEEKVVYSFLFHDNDTIELFDANKRIPTKLIYTRRDA